jgi:uncharacterized repeat protein (TIGR04076 family)
VYKLKVSVRKVMGTCTADPPMQPGDAFTVSNGDIRIPAGGYICMWALQSLLPLITPKERAIAEAPEDDWLWRVHHAQCPDPAGRVVFEIRQVGQAGEADDVQSQCQRPAAAAPRQPRDGGLARLRVVVDEVRGTCTSGLRPGDYFALDSGRLTIPPDRHFCLYALHAVLPMLPAKQRVLADDDWLKGADRVICPDPAGNVVMRIEAYPE